MVSGDPTGDSQAGEGPSDRFFADLARWAAGERVARAATQRSRTHSLLAQAASTATWSGVLLDLAERRAGVVIWTAGTQLTGKLVGLGRDFCVLERPHGGPCLIALAGVSSLTSPGADGAPRAAWAAGERRPALEMSMASVLEALAAEASPVSLRTSSGPVEGELIAVGQDIATVGSLRDRGRAGGARQLTHVPLAAIAWCELR